MTKMSYAELRKRLQDVHKSGDQAAMNDEINRLSKQERLPKRLLKRIVNSFAAESDRTLTLADFESMASLERARRFIGGVPRDIPKKYQRLAASKNKRMSSSRWQKVKAAIFARDKHTCQYCGSKKKPLHCDHVMPISRGGSNDPSNLVASCESCNLSKHDKTLEEWRPNSYREILSKLSSLR